MNTTMVVAVTGGIGSGKSTVCDLFAQRHGVPVIDADQVAREVVEPGEPGLAEIVEAFGAEVLDATGRLDRRRLKAIVFADAAGNEIVGYDLAVFDRVDVPAGLPVPTMSFGASIPGTNRGAISAGICRRR